MLVGGDWVVPQYLDELRLVKPVGIYWIQAISMSVFGDTQAAARLPSALAMLCVLGLMGMALPEVIGRVRAALAVLIVGTSLLVAYIARVAMTDAVLLLPITGAMFGLYAYWRGHRTWSLAVLMGLCLGVSTIIKGPILLFYLLATVAGLIVLRWTHRPQVQHKLGTVDAESSAFRSIGATLVVIGVAFAILLPWLLRIEARIPGYAFGTVSTEIVARGKSAMEGHSGPPGFYAILIWVTLFPWAIFLPAAVINGWRRRHVPMIRFSLAAVVACWIPLEIYQTKLPHYLLPIYPFLGILIADAIVRSMRGRLRDLSDTPFRITALVASFAVAIGILMMLVVPPALVGEQPWTIYLRAVLIAIPLGAMSILAGRLLYTKNLRAAVPVMALGSVASFLLITHFYAPHAKFLTLSRDVGESLLKHLPEGEHAWMVDYKEPSLAFHARGRVREQSNEKFYESIPRSDWPVMLITTQRHWQGVPEEIRASFSEVARHRGISLGAPDRLHEVLILQLSPDR